MSSLDHLAHRHHQSPGQTKVNRSFTFSVQLFIVYTYNGNWIWLDLRQHSDNGNLLSAEVISALRAVTACFQSPSIIQSSGCRFFWGVGKKKSHKQMLYENIAALHLKISDEIKLVKKISQYYMNKWALLVSGWLMLITTMSCSLMRGRQRDPE